jgi:NAD(P)-dependent dehydrogenase (short-subunit alcohol dehydrogenase family)
VAAGTAGTIEARTRALAVELAPVRVNAASPGTARSPLRSGMPEAQREARYRHVAETNLTRTVSDPDWIAPGYAFLTDQPFAGRDRAVRRRRPAARLNRPPAPPAPGRVDRLLTRR